MNGDAPDAPTTAADPERPDAERADERPIRDTPARHGLRWWREILYIASFFFVYSWIRNRFGSNAVGPDQAYAHARDMIDIEEALGLYVEPTIQSWFVESTADGLRYTFPGARGILRLWNVFYGTFHFIVTGGALLWVYRRFPVSYRKWRNTLAFTTALALLGFVLYPLMPPRLLTACTEFGQCLAGYGYVDTLREVGGLWSFESEGMEAVSNQYAAMPSLHFAWSLWSCFVLYPHVRRAWARALAVAYPVATLFAIVVTGNHYWIDAVGGALILAVGYVLGVALTRWTDRRRSRRTGTAAPDLQLRA